MKNLQEKNRLEFLWPNTFTENGRKLARNEGIWAAICLGGQYLIRLDSIFQEIDAGNNALEFDKLVYFIALGLLVFLAWRISRWGWISSIFVGSWSVFELVAVTLITAQPSVWNLMVAYIAFHGIRGCLKQRKLNKVTNN